MASERVLDAWGRLFQTIDPDSGAIEQYGYDPAGNTITYQDQNHDAANVRYEYDHLGRMLRVKQLESPPDDDGWIVTEYGYDLHGNLTSVTDANGNTTYYDVDDFGQSYEITSPVTGTTTMSYNLAGQLIERTYPRDPNGVTETRTYSNAGLIEGVVWDDGVQTTQQVSYAYTSGIRTSATTYDSFGKLVEESWTYDRRGLILSYMRTLPDIPVASKVISFGYDEDGNLTSQSIDGHTVTYVPDHAGRPTEILVGSTLVAQGIKYLAYGPAYEMTRGAVTETFGFDKSYRMTSQQVLNGASSLIDRGYSYDKAGNLAEINNNLSPERGKTFGYDDLGRLRSQTMHQSSSVLSYSYDSIGNRLMFSAFQEFDSATETNSWQQVEYSYANGGVSPLLTEVRTIDSTIVGNNFDQVETIQTITHDSVGNVTNDGLSSYTYDLRNKLVEQADAAGQPQVSFRYDSTGLRVYSVAMSGQRAGWSIDTHLQPDGNPLLEVTLDGNQAVVEEKLYISVGNSMLAIVEGTSVDHVISDHIGYPIALIDNLGSLKWNVNNRPFGDTSDVYLGSQDDDPLRRYPGQWKLDPGFFSTSTNLICNGHRWYNSEWGRYTQSDPFGPGGHQIQNRVSLLIPKPDSGYLEPHENAYSYSRSSPLVYIDSEGRISVKCARWGRDRAINAATRMSRTLKWDYLDRDGLQHCLASCYIVQKCSVGTATAAGWWHEITNLSRTSEPLRDLWNNRVGRKCAKKCSCETCCVRAVTNGPIVRYDRDVPWGHIAKTTYSFPRKR
jgi:RHS repeat-associated protein